MQRFIWFSRKGKAERGKGKGDTQCGKRRSLISGNNVTQTDGKEQTVYVKEICRITDNDVSASELLGKRRI